MIVELSATPPKESNKLVTISGTELHQEEMIRLDLRVVNKASTNWRDTMRAAMERRDDLQEKARAYEANTNVYIRPICLVQVERTGKEQRGSQWIHAEDVREYLIGQGVQKDWIAVKSAEIDELKEFDDIGGLLRGMPHPLHHHQAGSARRLGLLLCLCAGDSDQPAFEDGIDPIGGPHSAPAVCAQDPRDRARRELRLLLPAHQTYGGNSARLQQRGLARFGRPCRDGCEGPEDGRDSSGLDRERFSRRLRPTWCLPAFLIRDGKEWRLVSYEADILSRVPWDKADISPLFNLTLSLEEKRDVELRAGLVEDLCRIAARCTRKSKWRAVT